MNLQDYLTKLNTIENQWGIWVNPENPEEEYRIGQYCFENGGVKDDWICIGNLDSLSFGFQSVGDIIDYIFKEGFKGLEKGKNVNPEGVKEAYFGNRLDAQFQSDLEKEIQSVWEEWSKEEAAFFIDEKIPEIIKAHKEAKEIAQLINA